MSVFDKRDVREVEADGETWLVYQRQGLLPDGSLAVLPTACKKEDASIEYALNPLRDVDNYQTVTYAEGVVFPVHETGSDAPIPPREVRAALGELMQRMAEERGLQVADSLYSQIAGEELVIVEAPEYPIIDGIAGRMGNAVSPVRSVPGTDWNITLSHVVTDSTAFGMAVAVESPQEQLFLTARGEVFDTVTVNGIVIGHSEVMNSQQSPLPAEVLDNALMILATRVMQQGGTVEVGRLEIIGRVESTEGRIIENPVRYEGRDAERGVLHEKWWIGIAQREDGGAAVIAEGWVVQNGEQGRETMTYAYSCTRQGIGGLMVEDLTGQVAGRFPRKDSEIPDTVSSIITTILGSPEQAQTMEFEYRGRF